MLLNLQNSFEDRECMHYSLLNLIPFFLLVNSFPEFSQNSFEMQQIAAYCFSKEFFANPRNLSTNKKRGIALCGL
jgi:hypothetical protein